MKIRVFNYFVYPCIIKSTVIFVLLVACFRVWLYSLYIYIFFHFYKINCKFCICLVNLNNAILQRMKCLLTLQFFWSLRVSKKMVSAFSCHVLLLRVVLSYTSGDLYFCQICFELKSSGNCG